MKHQKPQKDKTEEHNFPNNAFAGTTRARDESTKQPLISERIFMKTLSIVQYCLEENIVNDISIYKALTEAKESQCLSISIKNKGTPTSDQPFLSIYNILIIN